MQSSASTFAKLFLLNNMALLEKLIVLGLAVSVKALPFMYYKIPKHDPSSAGIEAQLKKLLESEGLIDPTDIVITELQGKSELYRTSYKAYFFTKTTYKECYFKWRFVLYSVTSIADHSCSKMVPPKKKPTTIAPTTAIEEESTTPEEDQTTPGEDPTTTEEDPTTPEEDQTTPEEDPTTTEEDPTNPEEDPTTTEEDPTNPEEDPPTTTESA